MVQPPSAWVLTCVTMWIRATPIGSLQMCNMSKKEIFVILYHWVLGLMKFKEGSGKMWGWDNYFRQGLDPDGPCVPYQGIEFYSVDNRRWLKAFAWGLACQICILIKPFW